MRHTTCAAQRDRTQEASLPLLQQGCSVLLRLPSALLYNAPHPSACGIAEGLEETKATAVRIAEKIQEAKVGRLGRHAPHHNREVSSVT